MSFSAVQPTHRLLLVLSIASFVLFFLFGLSAEGQGRNQATDRTQAQGRTQAQKPARQAARGRAARLLTVEQYSRLTSEQRQNYIGALQDLYIKVESQQMHRGRPMRYSAVDLGGELHSGVGVKRGAPLGSEMITSFWAQVLGRPAWAQDSSPECVIAGVIRPLNDDGSCPTHGRPCELDSEPEENRFRCGMIFKEVCVPRTVDGQIGSLTQRCKEGFEALDNKVVTREEYNIIKDVYDRLLAKACENTKDETVCPTVKERLAQLQSQFGAPADESPQAGGRPEAPGGKPICSGNRAQIAIEKSPFEFDSVAVELRKVAFKKGETEDVIHCDASEHQFWRSEDTERTAFARSQRGNFKMSNGNYQLSRPRSWGDHLQISVMGSGEQTQVRVICKKSEIEVEFFERNSGGFRGFKKVGSYKIKKDSKSEKIDRARINFNGESRELEFDNCKPAQERGLWQQRNYPDSSESIQ